MLRQRRLASAALLSCLLLTSCAGSPAPVVSSPALPPESYTCLQAPLVPEGATLTDKGLALYITLLYNAWFDCAFQLHTIGKAHGL